MSQDDTMFLPRIVSTSACVPLEHFDPRHHPRHLTFHRAVFSATARAVEKGQPPSPGKHQQTNVPMPHTQRAGARRRILVVNAVPKPPCLVESEPLSFGQYRKHEHLQFFLKHPTGSIQRNSARNTQWACNGHTMGRKWA